MKRKVQPHAKKGRSASRRRPWRTRVRLLLLLAVVLAVGVYTVFCSMLLTLRWVDPPFTMVHVQRRVESWFEPGPYTKRYEPAPIASISPNLQHAVVSAEDGRFYQHHGIDWQEVGKVIEDDLLEEGRLNRGASTITQQLLKNLFATTHRSLIRKAAEYALVPAAELILPKQRILELYLNVVEWGPGVFGAQAASKYYYSIPAARLSRDQSARLAACLPAPRRRRPERMDRYANQILLRMRQSGY